MTNKKQIKKDCLIAIKYIRYYLYEIIDTLDINDTRINKQGLKRIKELCYAYSEIYKYLNYKSVKLQLYVMDYNINSIEINKILKKYNIKNSYGSYK